MRFYFPILILLFFAGCKKDNRPPDLQFKTGTGYTFADLVASPGGQFTVGLVANKTKDDLSLFYTQVAYDGVNVDSLVSRDYVPSSQKSHFEKDVTIHLRNRAGTERWVFSINDADGRISTKEIRVSVQ